MNASSSQTPAVLTLNETDQLDLGGWGKYTARQIKAALLIVQQLENGALVSAFPGDVAHQAELLAMRTFFRGA